MSSTDFAIALLRVVAGLTIAAHGYSKVFQGGRLAGTARWFDSIGMRPGMLHARAAAASEIIAGLMLAAGTLTALAAAGTVALMLVAAWTVHRPHGFFIVRNGWEYNLVLAVVAVAVAVAGAGRISIDRVLGLDATFAGWTGLLVAGVGGMVAGALHLATFYRPGRMANPGLGSVHEQ